MPQRWDAQGNPIPDMPPPTQRWDANGSPIVGDVPRGTSKQPQSTDYRDPSLTGAYQTRKGGPIQNTSESPIHAGVRAMQGTLGVNKEPSSLMDTFGQMASSFGNFAKESYQGLGGATPSEFQETNNLMAQGRMPNKSTAHVLATPFAAALTPVDMMTRGVEGIASGIDSSAYDLEKGVRTGNPNVTATGIGSVLGLKAILSTPEAQDFAGKVSETGRSLKQADAINRGQVQVVNEHVRKPIAMLDSKVNQEVGQHVKAAIDADNANMAATGSKAGIVNSAKAAEAANAKVDSMGITLPSALDDLVQKASQPMTLNEAKQLSTDVGRTAAALTRQGNYRPAAVMNELYNGLHEATQDRADDLGMGKSWKQYIDLTRTYKGMQEGLLGELVDNPNHAKVMDKLVDPSRASEFGEIVKEMQKRGVETSSFEKAREYAGDINRLKEANSASFRGKIKAIVKHPFLAGGAVAGAGMVGSATGIPGMGFVLPIIAAAKVSGILDAGQLSTLLKEINASVPADASRVNSPLPSPQAPPSSAAAKLGLLERPPSAPGLKSYQDSTTGGSIEMKEGHSDQELADKVQAHRAAMEATPESGKSDLASKKATDAKARMSAQYEQNIKNMLKSQFNFTEAAANNVTASIRGKYSGLDEGLKMAIAEAVKRSKR